MILDLVSQSSLVRDVYSDKYTRLTKSNKNFNIYEIASDYLKNNRMIFVVLPTLFEAQNYYDMLSNMLSEDDILFFPVDDMALASQFISSNEFKYERINTILTLLEGKPKIVVTTANGLIYKNFNPARWKKNIFSLEEGKTYDINEIKNVLVDAGYVHRSIVSSTGEFSFRGSIIDFYPLNYQNPIRLDFFDNELETIKMFNSETQRTLAKISKIEISSVEMVNGQKQHVVSVEWKIKNVNY